MGLFLMTALPVAATEEVQYDDVFINGYKLGFFEQLALEDHIDRDIADGNYWFELDTGMWGPVGGTAIGRIVVPEDYQDYVESKLSKQSQATKVELSASALKSVTTVACTGNHFLPQALPVIVTSPSLHTRREGFFLPF